MIPTTEAGLIAHIEALTDERVRRWRHNQPVKGIAEELEMSYDALRRLRAVRKFGTTEKIIKQARVERELEKLMAEEKS